MEVVNICRSLWHVSERGLEGAEGHSRCLLVTPVRSAIAFSVVCFFLANQRVAPAATALMVELFRLLRVVQRLE